MYVDKLNQGVCLYHTKLYTARTMASQDCLSVRHTPVFCWNG